MEFVSLLRLGSDDHDDDFPEVVGLHQGPDGRLNRAGQVAQQGEAPTHSFNITDQRVPSLNDKYRWRQLNVRT